MGKKKGFTRREAQIMDVLFATGGATVAEICRALPDPPTDMSIRRLVHILEEKGHVKRKPRGRENLFVAKRPKKAAGVSAFKHVVDTFFGGSVGDALAAHFASTEDLSQGQIDQLQELIENARKEGR